MAAFTTDWDTDLSSDSTDAIQIDDYMNKTRTDIEERLKEWIYGFVAGENDGVGGLIFAKFKEQAADLTTAASVLGLYAKDDSGTCLYARPESNGTAVKIIDANGNLVVVAGDYAADSIDEDDIQLANDAALQGEVAATGSSADIIKLNTDDVPELADGAVLAAATETADDDRTVADLGYAKTGDTVQHDAEGGYSNCDVDGTMAKVYTKYLTGTLDADTQTNVAHGITGIDNILHCSVVFYEDTSYSSYMVKEVYQSAAAATLGARVTFDATNVVIYVNGTQYQGNKYRIRLDYIV